MDRANRYGGSSRGQRSLAAMMSGAFVLLLLVGFGQAIGGAWARVAAPIDRLIAFTVMPPPPPPPALDRSREAPRPAAASARHLDRRRAPADPVVTPYVAAPAALAPITASTLSSVSLPPSSDLHVLDDVGGDVGGGGDGGGRGTGSGAGDGGGSTRPVKLARADWIVPPKRRDVERAWPRTGLDIAGSVDVVLLCEVRSNGHPFDCLVARESLPGKGFGAAAIRAVHDSLIKPMTIDDQRVDTRVVIPITFIRAKGAGKPPHPQLTPSGQPPSITAR